MENQSKVEVIKSFVDAGLEMECIRLVETFSQDFSSISKAVGGKPLVLCHIDGSHVENDVYQDFTNVEAILSADRIVIGDDFWNKSQLPVMTAIFRLVLEDSIDLKPFMIANTKIYTCRQDKTKFYRQTFENAFRDNVILMMFSEWLEARQNKKWYYTEQKMSKWPVIIM